MLVGLESKALTLLATCARDGLFDLLWIDHSPLFAPLRSTKKFGEIRD
ncbi:MAG: hypothetical protein IPM54_06580 [Polyangiaceae bacterium]|nr:hypothetical protein [Polyangiaceae bacterium]